MVMTRRRKAGIAALVLLVLLVLDLTRAPADQVSAKVLLGGIHLYQATLSPLNRRIGVRCRFTPTCSHYGEGAIRKYGALVGTGKTIWRILRCGPWTPAGTVDPP
jgi:putative membrane protein insertion efficiency factor